MRKKLKFAPFAHLPPQFNCVPHRGATSCRCSTGSESRRRGRHQRLLRVGRCIRSGPPSSVRRASSAFQGEQKSSGPCDGLRRCRSRCHVRAIAECQSCALSVPGRAVCGVRQATARGTSSVRRAMSAGAAGDKSTSSSSTKRRPRHRRPPPQPPPLTPAVRVKSEPVDDIKVSIRQPCHQALSVPFSAWRRFT